MPSAFSVPQDGHKIIFTLLVTIFLTCPAGRTSGVSGGGHVCEVFGSGRIKPIQVQQGVLKARSERRQVFLTKDRKKQEGIKPSIVNRQSKLSDSRLPVFRPREQSFNHDLRFTIHN
jgi:hypothetical protein